LRSLCIFEKLPQNDLECFETSILKESLEISDIINFANQAIQDFRITLGGLANLAGNITATLI
jgi:hypothetical protein